MVDGRCCVSCSCPAGTGDTVAVMITEAYGKDLLAHLDRNLTVLVSVIFRPNKISHRGSLVFVSISFIVLMIISSAWLIFYFIQKIRYGSSNDRSQVTSHQCCPATNICPCCNQLKVISLLVDAF